MRQTGFAIITRFDLHHLEMLKKRVSDIKNERHEKFLDLGSVPGLHFASIVICVDPERRFDPFLVFEHNIDGTTDCYLPVLYELAAPALRHIYECCQGYPAGAATHRDPLLEYLSQHVCLPNAILMGRVGGTVETIKREKELHDEIQKFLGHRRACAEAAHIKSEIDAFVDRTGLVDGLPEPPVGLLTTIWNFFRLRTRAVNAIMSPSKRAGAFAIVAPAIVYGVYASLWIRIAVLSVVAFVVIWLTLLRWADLDEPVLEPNAARTRELAMAEALNKSVHNHLALTAIVKPGRMRLLTLKFVLRLISLLTRGVGKPDVGIHFAQWTLVPDKKCDVLLFLSNYDGGWASYLDLFIDRAHHGINAIWGNALNFPRTKFFLFAGARDGRRLKEAIRAYQHAASVQYCAYPDLPVRNVNNNSQIRHKIGQKLSTSEINEWLWLF